jgi:predicted ATPase
MTIETEVVSTTGKIVVITGRRGSGKDFLIAEAFKHQKIQELGLKRVVTHANYETRGIRPGETDGVDYHFRLLPEMEIMALNKEFVEDLMETGENAYKATSKAEIMRVLNGEVLLWRIEMRRAAEVASGDFFPRLFPPDVAAMLNESTKVILIDVTEEELAEKRALRLISGAPMENFTKVDDDERSILSEHGHHFKHRIKNPIGKLEETLSEILRIIQS